MARTTQKRTALPVSSDNDEGAERESETLNQQSTQMPVNKASTSTSGVHSTSRPGSRRNGSAKPIDTQSKADGAMELEGDESDVAELQPDRKPKPSALKKPSSRVSNGAVAFSHKRKVVISGTERDVSESLLPPPKRTRSETEWDAIVQQVCCLIRVFLAFRTTLTCILSLPRRETSTNSTFGSLLAYETPKSRNIWTNTAHGQMIRRGVGAPGFVSEL